MMQFLKSVKHYSGRRYVDVKRPLLRFYEDYVNFYVNLYLLHRKPVVIYQMGKVGSSTLYRSLKDDVFVCQVHSLNPAFLKATARFHRQHNLNLHWAASAWLLHHHIMKPRKSVQFISLTRDPISRNVAEFFQNYRMYIDPTRQLTDYSVAELRDYFLERGRHERCLVWFDREFQTILGVNVYAHPFPYEAGYQRLLSDYGEILIMRIETDDATLEKAVQDFLNKPGFRLSAANVGTQKSYADTYRAFKQQVKLPEAYLDRMLNSRYARHFYTPAEREAVRRRWSE